MIVYRGLYCPRHTILFMYPDSYPWPPTTRLPPIAHAGPAIRPRPSGKLPVFSSDDQRDVL